MAIAMDPRTGDVLALALRPTFNPNAFLDVASRDVWRNRAVTDPFEPGSTFKVILAAAALEEGVVRPDDRIWAENGQLTIAKTTIHDWRKFGWLTFGEVLQNSSNVGSMKVGLALGRDRYHRYMTAFGFGAPTGVGLPGESRGVLRDPQRWSLLWSSVRPRSPCPGESCRCSASTRSCTARPAVVSGGSAEWS